MTLSFRSECPFLDNEFSSGVVFVAFKDLWTPENVFWNIRVDVGSGTNESHSQTFV